MTAIIRYALAIEASLDILGATVFLFFPDWCLSQVVFQQSSSFFTSTSSIPATSATLLQVYACMVFALGLPLFLLVPDRPGVAEKRALLYQVLCLLEVILTELLLWKAMDPEGSGFSGMALLMAAGSLVPLFAWKAWVIVVRPDLFGDDDERVEKKEQ